MMCLCNFFFLTLRKLGVCDKTFSQNVSFYAFEIISYKSSFPKDGTRETKDNQDVSKATSVYSNMEMNSPGKGQL